MAVKKIGRMLKGNLIICFTSPRIYIALILCAILFQQIENPVRILCAQTGYSISPWLYPHLTALYYIQNIIVLGAVLIFCDAPFIKNNTSYVMIRMGRNKWFASQILYIMVMSAVYIGLLYLISILLLLPYVGPETGWGKIIGTLAQTDAAAQIGGVMLDYQMLLDYSPWEALSVTCGMSWMIISFTGLLIMFFNMFGNHYLGAAAGAMVSFTPYFARIFSDMYAGYYIAPPTWMSVTIFGRTGASPYPTIPYAVCFLASGIVLLIFGSYKRLKHQTFDTSVVMG